MSANPIHQQVDVEVAAKFTAAEVQQACPTSLLGLQKLIAAHLSKAGKYTEKADQHRTSACRYLAQVREICDEGGFDAFHEKFFPDLGRSRVYELLAIGTGKKSVEDIKTSTRERVARHRAKHRASVPASVTVTDGTSVAPTPSVTFVQAEIPIEERRARMAALADGPETLVEHWHRASAAERTKLYNNPEFRRELRARQPGHKADKPYKHTLNLKANSAPDRREHRSRQ
jgi:hypothetical protein